MLRLVDESITTEGVRPSTFHLIFEWCKMDNRSLCSTLAVFLFTMLWGLESTREVERIFGCKEGNRQPSIEACKRLVNLSHHSSIRFHKYPDSLASICLLA